MRGRAVSSLVLAQSSMDGFFRQVAAQVEAPAPTSDSIIDMVTHSGLVVQSVLYLLLVFSIVSWGIIFYKFLQIYKARRESERFSTIFWETKNFSSIHGASLEMKESPIAQVFRAGYQELMRLTRARKQTTSVEGEPLNEEGGIENIERAMRRAMRRPRPRAVRAKPQARCRISTARPRTPRATPPTPR